jgi:hypothetical protein
MNSNLAKHMFGMHANAHTQHAHKCLSNTKQTLAKSPLYLAESGLKF